MSFVVQRTRQRGGFFYLFFLTIIFVVRIWSVVLVTKHLDGPDMQTTVQNLQKYGHSAPDTVNDLQLASSCHRNHGED